MRIAVLSKTQRGQGMTEYIIIVALIAIGAIGVYSAFGNVVKGQTASIAAELGGQSSKDAQNLANRQGSAANDRAREGHTLKNFQDSAATSR